MSTTIVFACKSNSCRSQMAEAWAREWIKAERKVLESRKQHGHASDGSESDLRTFMDGLFVASVALDDSCVASTTYNESMPYNNLVSTVECITCDGEVCPISTRRRRPKEKAIQAMARDGVDISNYNVKSIRDLFPILIGHQQGRSNNKTYAYYDHTVNPCEKHRRLQLLLSRFRDMLEGVSREIGMAFAGISKDSITETIIADTTTTTSVDDEQQDSHLENNDTKVVVDNLIVLCSCPESMKHPWAKVSRQILCWDIDPPSAAAINEGDVAFVRVSRQIRQKVNEFMDQLKNCAIGMEQQQHHHHHQQQQQQQQQQQHEPSGELKCNNSIENPRSSRPVKI